MQRKASRGLTIAVAMLIGACAPIPAGPSVMVLAGPGKTWEQFHADDGACRQAASEETQRTKSADTPAQRRYDVAYMQCMYAKGHQIPSQAQPPRGTSSSTDRPPGTPGAAPAVWPPTPAQIDCERNGGVWRAALDFCEFPSPDIPFRRWR